MSSAHKNLSVHTDKNLINMEGKKVAIVVAEWNSEITEALYEGAYNTLLKHGSRPQDILRYDVPGSFELSLGSQYAAIQLDIQAVIALGCVIQGETRHFDFICQAVAQGLTQVALHQHKPVIFGVLTPDNQQQALDRAGGKHGNKGEEAAITAIKMLSLAEQLPLPF
jgi:6,7-dimethyl-8-ribityllumazine synthase